MTDVCPYCHQQRCGCDDPKSFEGTGSLSVARSSKEHLYDEMLTMLQRIATIPIGSSIPGSEIESLIKRASRAAPETSELSRALHTIDEAGKLSDWINSARPIVTDLMQAYERRIRTDCTPEQLAKEPWRCMEYIAAERLLAAQPVAVVEITAVKANEQANTPRFSPAIEAQGMTWWNGCSEAERAHWLKKAGSAAPADAWQAFRTSENGEAVGKET